MNVKADVRKGRLFRNQTEIYQETFLTESSVVSRYHQQKQKRKKERKTIRGALVNEESLTGQEFMKCNFDGKIRNVRQADCFKKRKKMLYNSHSSASLTCF